MKLSRESKRQTMIIATEQLPDIPNNTDIWVTTDKCYTTGQMVTTANTPRSYIVETPNGKVHRNHSQLNIQPSDTNDWPRKGDVVY